MASASPHTETWDKGVARDLTTIGALGWNKDGYTFKGWNTSSSATSGKYADGSIQTFNNDINIYAIWEIKKYTVRFYAYQSASVPIKTVQLVHGTSPASYAPTREEMGIRGWTFDGWHERSGLSTISDGVTHDVDFYAYWYTEVNNIIAQTATIEGSNTTTPSDVPNDKSWVWLAHIAWASELSFPAGATVSIAYLMGLLNHDGNSTRHYLSIAPCMISSQFQYDTRTNIGGKNPNAFSKINENWKSIYYGERTWNASKGKWVYTNVLDTSGVNLGINIKNQTNTPPSSSLTTDWGKYAPLQRYNEFHWYDDSSLYDSTGARIPVADWRVLTSKFVGHWSRPTDLGPNSLDPMLHSHLSSTISTNKSVNNGLVQIELDDYCSEDRMGYPIPATLGDGYPVNELTLFLSKNSSGCTVEWRFLIHQLKFDLR